MRSFLRSLGAVFLGLAAAAVIIAAVEAFNSRIYPLPAGVAPTDRDAMRAAVAAMPGSAFVLVVVAWGLGALAGAWAAARLAARSPRAHAAIVTVVLLAGGIANMIMLPHPLWVWVAAVAAFLVGGHLGTLVAMRSSRK
jgi:hypothetical protein